MAPPGARPLDRGNAELRLYGVLGNSGRRDAGHAYQFIGNSSLPVII